MTAGKSWPGCLTALTCETKVPAYKSISLGANEFITWSAQKAAKLPKISLLILADPSPLLANMSLKNTYTKERMCGRS